MNARIKPWSVVTIDWNNYYFEKEFRLNLTGEALKLIRDRKNNINNVLNQKTDNPVRVDINLEWSLINLKITDILLLDEINSHKVIIPRFSEYYDESWKMHNLTDNIVLNYDNKKAIRILNLIKIYEQYWEESYIDLQISGIWNIKIHIKFFLLNISHISPIDIERVFIDEFTPVKEIIENGKDPVWNPEISTIPTKIDFVASPHINLPFEKIIAIKQWLPIPKTDGIKSFEYDWKTFQFNISDVHLTN